MFDRLNDRITPLVTIVLAFGIALLIWVSFRLFGVDPWISNGDERQTIHVIDIVLATAVAGLAAWGVRQLLARRGRSTWWPFVGSTALAVSMLGPSYRSDGGSAVALTCMHVAVGFILIRGLAPVGMTHECTS